MPDAPISMDQLVQTFHVAYTHRIFFTRSADAAGHPALDAAMGDTRRAMIVIEEAVHLAHPQYAENLLVKLGARGAGEVSVFPGGERCKQEESLWRAVVQLIHDRRIDRHEAVLAIGGGAFLDAVGFAAATAHRGVRLIRFPTTTLAQADSGIGVKCGLNTFSKKNFTGSFQVPYAVVNDSAFLFTQDPETRSAGLVEAVKVALIKDPEFFTWIASNVGALRDGRADALEHAVRRSAEWHFRHITTGGDPFEMGSSRPLDFGHWAAHKLEGMSGHVLSHAEAVSIGLALDVTYSQFAGWLSAADHQRILGTLSALGMPVFHPLLTATSGDGSWPVLGGLEEFREHLGGRLTLLMLEGIGQPREIHEVDTTLLAAAARHLSRMA